MDIVNLLITLVSGIVGGNAAGAAMPENKNLGTLGNTLSGIVGGGLGAWILQALELFHKSGLADTVGTATAAQGLDIGQILATVGSSGIGGAALTVIISLIKGYIAKNQNPGA